MVVLRRLLWLLAFGGAAAASFVVWQRRGAVGTAGTASPHGSHAPHAAWPVFDPAPPAPGAATHVTDPDPDPDAGASGGLPPTWVPPVDGACPDGYPVKAKQSSGIYHLPGGRFYAKTVPDRCYANPADAEADGYRASKS